MSFALLFLLACIALVASVIYLKIPLRKTHEGNPKILSSYEYRKKEYIMTQAEAKCFQRLEVIAGKKYYVFPQVHLSSLLNHTVTNGQNWRAALSKIQRKSVDFVLVDKQSLKTVYAIELDDKTHDIYTDRKERDALVEEIFKQAGLPLVRLRGINMLTDEDIIAKIQSSMNLINPI